MSRRGAAAPFALLYAAQFGFLGVQLPFFARWLEGRGFDAASIGLLGGAALALRLVTATPLAYRAEHARDPRRPLRIALLTVAALALCLLAPLPTRGTGAVVVALLVLFGLTVPLVDASVLRADREGSLQYGRVRSVGSLGFIGASLFGGAVVGLLGEQSIALMMAGLALAMFGASLTLPPVRSTAEGPRPHLDEALRLLRSPAFLLALAATGLCQGSHAVYYTFTALHWEAAGYADLTVGMLWTAGVVVEVLVLVFGRALLRRADPALLIGLGCAAAALRWPATGLSPPLPVLFGLQLLHAGTFAAAFLGSIEFVGEAVPPQYRATAMTVFSTLGVGAMTGIATVAAGQAFEAAAPFPAYAGMGAMGVTGLVLAMALRARWSGGLLAGDASPRGPGPLEIDDRGSR